MTVLADQRNDRASWTRTGWCFGRTVEAVVRCKIKPIVARPASPVRQSPRVTLYATHDTVSTLQWAVRLSLYRHLFSARLPVSFTFTQPLRVPNIRTVPKVGLLTHISLRRKVVQAQAVKSPHFLNTLRTGDADLRF